MQVLKNMRHVYTLLYMLIAKNNNDQQQFCNTFICNT